MSLRIDIWSDIICPYCYIGKKRLEHIAAQEGIELDIHWHSYELMPEGAAQYKESLPELLAKRYGMSVEQAIQAEIRTAQAAAEEGIDFQWQQAKPGNTFNMHRLLQYAQTQGLATALDERFMHAYFTEGQAIGDVQVIAKLAIEAGLAEKTVWEILESDQFAKQVRDDEYLAQQLKIRGVPFIVFEEKVAIPGALPREAFRETLKQMVAEKVANQPLSAANAQGEICADGVCAVPNNS
ncbi:DsbA family oxidoreductase [uncultured Thiothrix sp.]|uniref:DsbA family oxidoreductase n=1 Tax=uncultured Thiothrix sp. TaxID=223185 RepID=UPI0026366259|nr:DsbA family oxidoreductase [uncultured Thiothrix sp.]